MEKRCENTSHLWPRSFFEEKTMSLRAWSVDPGMQPHSAYLAHRTAAQRPGSFHRGCKSPFWAGWALSIMEWLTGGYLHSANIMGKSISGWQCRKWAVGGITVSRTTTATPCGYHGRFCKFSCKSLPWVVNNKTPFQLQGFLGCLLSWAKQPLPPSPDEKTEIQRGKEMRPATGDQIGLADWCSKHLVLQIKQGEKYSPFLSAPRWFLTFSSSFWAEGDVTQLKTETLNAQ